MSNVAVIGGMTFTVAVAVVATTVVTMAVVLVTSQMAVYDVVCFGATLMTLPVWAVDQRTAPPAGQPEAVSVLLVPAQTVAALTATVRAAGAATCCGLDAHTCPR